MCKTFRITMTKSITKLTEEYAVGEKGRFISI